MKKTLLIILLTIISTSIFANKKGGEVSDTIPYLGTRHYIGMYFGGGIHTQLYGMEHGENTPGAGGLFELNYILIPKKIGFGIGALLASSRSNVTINGTYEQTLMHNDNNQEHTRDALFTEWKETQDILFFEIPLSLMTNNPINDKTSFCMNLGVNLSLPIIAKYSTRNGNIVTSGYFESTNVQYTDLENHGFGTYDSGETSTIENTKVSVGTHLELGFNHKMKEKSAFYFGVYAYYGITPCIENMSQSLYDTKKYVGVFSSENINEIHPLRAGVKLGFRFDLKDSKKENEADKIVKERRKKRETKEDVLASAEQLKQDWLSKEQEEKIRIEEENQKNLKLEEEKNDAKVLALAREKRDASYALKKIADAAIYAGPNSEPKFPEEIERSFDVVYTYLAKNANLYINVIGHTDNKPSPEKSMKLGEKRAEVFKKALIKKGIPEDRINCVSKGQSEPVATNNTVEGRELNNRTELNFRERE